MPQALIQPEPAQHRPFKVSKTRRRVMSIVTLLLWSIIGAYVYYTNESRVREMASNYLAEQFGGKVTIVGAELSLFEGLKLSHVRITPPDSGAGEPPLLDADSVLIRYNLGGLLAGKLAGTQIIVVNPHVRLSEDARTGRWNYQAMQPGRWRAQPGKTGEPMATMAEVLLRDAQVDYVEVNGAQPRQAGWLALDGRFGPSDQPGKYEFSFQSRGRAAMGPAVSGTLEPARGIVWAQLSNVTYGPDIEAMLPALVRQWCRDHNLAGQVAVSMEYVPAAGTFEVRADLNDVEMSVHPSGTPGAIAFDGVSGRLTFTNDGVTAQDMTVSLENNRFVINGAIEGYTVDSPLDLTIQSAGDFNLAEHLPFTANLPKLARDVYERFHPIGRGQVSVRLVRPARGGSVRCEATVDVLDGGFTFADIPYPVAHAVGKIVVGRDAERGFDTVKIVNLAAHGISGGPNQNAELTINGWIGPLDLNPGGHMDLTGRNLHAEPRLLDSLPPPAKAALKMLNADGKGLGPGMVASFVSHADHAANLPVDDKRWAVDIDLDATGAHACYEGFAYPLENTGGRIEIRPGYADLINVGGKHGEGTVVLGGRISFPADGSSGELTPNLTLHAKNLAIDDALIAALPAESKRAMEVAGVSGKLDAAGTITNGYDLNLTIKDGALAPDGRPAATDVAGRLHATADRIEAVELHGRRGAATFTASGFVDHATHPETIFFTADAQNLTLDERIRGLLPASALAPWDALQPGGTVDGSIQIHRDTKAPAAIRLTLKPRDMTVAPKLAPESEPFALQHVTGNVTLELGKLATWDMTGQHGQAKLNVAGSWRLDDPNAPWELRLAGEKLPIDAELIKQMPGGLASVLTQLGLTGQAGFEFSRLSYRRAAATQPSAGPDVEFAVKVSCDDGAMSLGVPLSGLAGSADLTGTIRNGQLHELDGTITASKFSLAGRAGSDLVATLKKPAAEQTVHLSDLSATVAGGKLAGALAVGLADTGPSRYALSLALEGADVRALTGTHDPKISGEVSASLELSGSAASPGERRGRGDVRVYGAQMYQIPLVLGLFQVTNLSLPISSPFERAGARYIIQGERVTLEDVQLSNKDLAMNGYGHIDFGSKQVDMTFATASPDWIPLPLLGAMWNNAHKELLRIHVRGSIQEPKVQPTSLDTVTTTVDQVLSGGAAK